MIKAIIFDCFGVLVGRGFEETYRTAGGDPIKDQEFITDMLGQTNLGLISQADFNTAMATKLGITDQDWQDVLHKVEQPNMELLAYIKELRQQYKLAVLSNANRGLIDYLESMSGEHYFDDIIVSAEVGLTKPDPEIYSYTAERLGVELDECVFIDDREALLEPAKALGMWTILYQDFAQLHRDLAALLTQSGT